MEKNKPVYLLYFQPGFFPYDKVGNYDPELYGVFEDLEEAKSFEDVSSQFRGEWRSVYDFDLGQSWKVYSTYELGDGISDESRAEYSPPLFYIIESIYYPQSALH
jgi:hypothetical protein